MDEFKINVVAVTHDNASNMDTCLSILGYAHFRCAGHTLQLAVNDGLKIADVSKTLAKCCNLVGVFHRSVVASDALQKVQKLSDGKGKSLTLVQDVQTT